MRVTVSMLLALSLGACSSEIDNKPVAEVAPVQEVVAPVEAPVEVTGTAYAVDLAASKFEFVGAKVTGDHKGGFTKFEGSALVNAGKVVGTDFSIDLSSVFTDAEKLTAHLKDADFFDVATFATSTFTSRDIQEVPPPATPATDPNALVPTHSVTGELDLHGVKKSITFPALIAVAADKATVKAEFVINRKDFNIVYAGKPDDLIKDEVLIKLDLSFPLVAAPTEPTPTADGAGAAPTPTGGPGKPPGIGKPLPGGPPGVGALPGGPGLKAKGEGETQGKAVEGGERKK